MTKSETSNTACENRFGPPPHDTEQSGSGAALLIDDHPAIRFAFRQLLLRVPIYGDIHECGSGVDGVALFSRIRPVLSLLDLDLPDIDGLEVVRRIRRIDVNARILVVSAMDEQMFAIRSQRAGASGFVSKTRGIDVLEAALRSVLSGMECFPASAVRTGLRPHPTGVLSDREMGIARCLSKGMRNKDIAVSLFINEKTVSTHKSRIFRKLGVRNVIELKQLYGSHAAATQDAVDEEGGEVVTEGG